MGSSGKPQEPNFSVFDNYIQEPAYLTGMIAGGMSKSGKIGMVGGFPIPEVNRLMNAFMAGAKEVNPKAEFTSPSSTAGSTRPRPRKPPSR
jgi:basic membrane protein A